MSGGIETATAAAEARSVVAWRRRQLRAAGFGCSLARSLARDGRVSLHALLSLVDRGCPPELAARILAPLDEEAGT
ncbi:MAG TPA: hypothetical protein VFR63_11705 [Gaiellaceae bacterium]|nr:hypothetical protein [Gaiellaceae bacterium]